MKRVSPSSWSGDDCTKYVQFCIVWVARDVSRPLVQKIAEYLGYSELPALYEEYLEYLKERRRKLRELARVLDEQAEGEVGSPSAELNGRWKDGKGQSGS